MKRNKVPLALLGILGCLVVIAVLGGQPAQASSAAYSFAAQTTEPEVAVLPEALTRLSWSAVIAGTLMTLIIMFVLNLLGVALGLTTINPEYGKDSADAKSLAVGGLVWIAVSNLVALFVGGWLAAYFAGIPEPTDGLLHGLMVWALSSIITVLLVMSGLGRIMNGVAGLVGSGMQLTGAVTSGAAHFAGDAVGAVGGAAGSVAGGLGSLSAQALSVLARGVQDSAQLVGNSLNNLTDTAIENTPDVQNALGLENLSVEQIRAEARRLLRQATHDPQQVRQAVNSAVDDVQNAAQQAARHPDQIDDILGITLQRLFSRGQTVINQVDRDSLLNLLTENTDMTHEQAEQQVQRWQEQFQQAQQQTAQARESAMQKAQQLRDQAEQRAREIYEQAQARVEELQREAEERINEVRTKAEHTAREAAQSATEAFSRVALAIAAALVIGAVASGIGGYIGAPQYLPDVPIDQTSNLDLDQQ